MGADRLAELPLQHCQRGMRDVTDRPKAKTGQDLPGLLPHPPQGGHRQRVEEVEHLIVRYHKEPVRLAQRRCELGHELAVGHPYRTGDALLVADARPDQLADPGGPPQSPDGSGDVEERLV